MATVLDGCVYHRRLDRSHENEGFYHLPENDRKLIGELRSAMSGARHKVKTLQDTIEDKDRHICREGALRRAAVDRMEQLVDMYGDPAVMAELRDRLPRSGGDDPKVTWSRNLQQQQQQQQPETSRALSRYLQRKRGVRMHSPEPVSEASSEVKRHHKARSQSADRQRSSKSSHRRQTRSDNESEDDDRPRRRRSAPDHPPHYYYPYPFLPHPGLVYMQAAPSGAAVPGGPAVQPAAAATVPDRTAGDSGDSPPRSGGPAPRDDQTGRDVIAHGRLHAVREASQSREQNRQISLLLAELDSANEMNEKLQLKLTRAEKELESIQISQQTLKTSLEADASGKAAALVAEIYGAQKQRDEAMIRRLKTANEERDAALARLKQTETGSDGYESGPDDNPDNMDVRALLRGVTAAESARQIKHRGGALLDSVERRQRQRNAVSADEMRAVLDQRDDAVDKAKAIECELLRVQRVQRGRTAEKQQQATEKAKLLATQHERDVSIEKVRKLEEELQTLRVYYSLHKSLSQEASLRDQFNHTLQDFEGELKQRNDVVDLAQKESHRLSAAMHSAVSSRNEMTERLAKAALGQKEAEDRCQRLERLVNVLRRKINGLGSKSDDY